MAAIKYPTDMMHLEADAKAISQHVQALNDPETGPTESKELMFRIGLRLLRIEQEAKAVGRFVDALTQRLPE